MVIRDNGLFTGFFAFLNSSKNSHWFGCLPLQIERDATLLSLPPYKWLDLGCSVLSHTNTDEGSSAIFVTNPGELCHFDLIWFSARCVESHFQFYHILMQTRPEGFVVWLKEALTVHVNDCARNWGEKCDGNLYQWCVHDKLKIIASFRSDSLALATTEHRLLWPWKQCSE